MDDYEASTSGTDGEVTRRLAAFASPPLDPDVAAHCVRRLRDSARPRRRVTRAAVLVAALASALLVSSVGLAAADTLPDSMQEVAHRALDKVGVHVPPGHERYNDPAECPGGPYKNHGAYVRAHKDDPEAGKSPCGKPVKSVTDTDGSPTEVEPGDVDRGEDHVDTGPPPWANGKSQTGKGDKKTKDTKDVAEDEVGDDQDDPQGDDAQGEDAPAEVPPASSTTTSPGPSSTTTVASSTTTVAPTTTTNTETSPTS